MYTILHRHDRVYAPEASTIIIVIIIIVTIIMFIIIIVLSLVSLWLLLLLLLSLLLVVVEIEVASILRRRLTLPRLRAHGRSGAEGAAAEYI